MADVHNEIQDIQRQLARVANLIQDEQNDEIRENYEGVFQQMQARMRQLRGMQEPEEEPEEEPAEQTGGKIKKSMVQSVLFDKSEWSAKKARQWLEKKGFRSGKLHETGSMLRFRQQDPDQFQDFRAQRLKGKPSIIFIHGLTEPACE